jgi:hypothetical protein
VVVGSALLEAVDRGGVEGGRAFLRSLRDAMDAVTPAGAGSTPRSPSTGETSA